MTDPQSGGPVGGAMVATYRGAVPAQSLGWTLTHEHLFVLSPELDGEYPHPEWQVESAITTAISELETLYDLGIHTLVDLTVPGLGRNIPLVSRVAEQVRMNIVATTGWYTDEALPPFFRTHGPGRLVGGEDLLLAYFLKDIEEGIGGTPVRAGMLKVVTDEPGITTDVARIMAAAAQAQVRTGVPITTHSNPRLRNGIDQVDFLLNHGARPAQIVVGHSGDTDDLDYLRQLLDRGVTLGFDRFGMAHTGADESRIRTLQTLLEAGHVEQIVLSHDSAIFSRVTPPSWRKVNAPLWRHDHLSRRVLPELRKIGVSEPDLDAMMRGNAQRLLAPGGAVR